MEHGGSQRQNIYASVLHPHLCRPSVQNDLLAYLAFNIAHLISIIFSTCFICRSMMYRFDKTIPNGHCGDLVSFRLYTAITTLISDAMVVVLPMPMLWGLQMQTKKRLASAVFSEWESCERRLTPAK
jgi:hypothetical protein